MDKKEEWMKEEYQDLIRDIESNSPYKRTPSPQKKWMSVTEMGALLGLKKTDRYWLLHKNVFESREIAGKLRVNIASFEKWYANQVKYQKVTGEEPGLELKKWSYSVRDIAQLISFGLADEQGYLTNAGALLADESPIRWSRKTNAHTSYA